MNRTTYVWVAGFVFVGSVFCARYLPQIQFNWLAALPLLVLALKRGGWVALVSVIATASLLGLLRSQPWQASLGRIEARIGEEATVTGRVVTDTIYDRTGQTQFEVDNLTVNGVPEKGKVRVKTFTQPAIFRHDEVKIVGKLRTGFGTRVATLSFAQVEVVGRSVSPVESVRRTFGSALYTSLSEEEAALALGILVGQRTTISEENDENLRVVGLTHIIAVSGYNLTVLVRLSRRGLGFLSKFQKTLVSVLLVALFLLVAGNSASIVRAAWVVGLSLYAGYFGRNVRPIVLLSVSAAATAWFDPHYVWFDLGWWLSFSAFYGVLMLAPAITERLYRAKKPGFVMQVAIESFAASVLTMPLILWVFERVSVVSLLSNLIVVPLIPYVMIVSFAAGLSYIATGLSIVTRIVAWVSSVALSFILAFAERLASLPFAELSFSITTIQMIAMYACIIIATYMLSTRLAHRPVYNLLE